MSFALAAAVSAGHASSYVKRSDGYDHSHSSYGVYDNHHSPLVYASAVTPYAYGSDYGYVAPVEHTVSAPVYSPYTNYGYQPVYDDHHHEALDSSAYYGYGGYAPDYNKDYHSYPKYKFEYGVKDPHTGDHKSQWEVRDGDVVKGEYTLDEADGTKRIVSYTADDHNGFNAVVKKVGHAIHPETYQPHNAYGNGYYQNYYGNQYHY